MYILINGHERAECENEDYEICKTQGKNFLVYNTNLVFDRDGRVISRYRKYNLYNEEPYVSVPAEAVPEYFDTDFGVRFGHIVCFDILFENPALKLVREYNVTDVIHPSHWVSASPLAYSVEIQAAWAFGNDVNLLATGANYPIMGAGG